MYISLFFYILFLAKRKEKCAGYVKKKLYLSQENDIVWFLDVYQLLMTKKDVLNVIQDI